MGMAPANARIGDTICMLYGGKAPYIVRRKHLNLLVASKPNMSHCWEFYRQCLYSWPPNEWRSVEVFSKLPAYASGHFPLNLDYI